VIRPRRRHLGVASLLGALALAGCAHMQGDATVCPEYRALRCATAPECSMDQARGCRVCACSPSRSADREGRLTNPIAPDQRIPDRR
jgi:hypothetical protein